jgi:hypothetical protein
MEVVATAPAAQHPQNGAPTSHGESGSSVDAHGGSDAQKPHARPRNLMPGPFHDGRLRPPSTPPVQDILTFSSPRLLALLSPYVFTPSLWWFAAR